jgi:hypothetical protein
MQSTAGAAIIEGNPARLRFPACTCHYCWFAGDNVSVTAAGLRYCDTSQMIQMRTRLNETPKPVRPPGEITMTKTHFWIIGLSMTVFIAGCKDRNQPARSSSSATNNPPPKSISAPPTVNNVPEQWLGKWIGPEGTYLVLSKNAEQVRRRRSFGRRPHRIPARWQNRVHPRRQRP